MPRQPRIVIPNTPHHITQRGNYRQSVFDNEKHYKRYCQWVNEYAIKYKVDVLAYCLMNSHVHFIVIPKEEDTLARLFNTLHMRYAQYINRERRIKGHLWQGRFFSCVLDDKHLYRAIRYVENNPLRAKIVKEAWGYEWSSAKDHVGERKERLITLKDSSRGDWRDYLKEDDVDMTTEIRSKTNKCLAIGTNKFIEKLEETLKRSLKGMGPGRPKKKGRCPL